jgi:hypothetical protein
LLYTLATEAEREATVPGSLGGEPVE